MVTLIHYCLLGTLGLHTPVITPFRVPFSSHGFFAWLAKLLPLVFNCVPLRCVLKNRFVCLNYFLFPPFCLQNLMKVWAIKRNSSARRLRPLGPVQVVILLVLLQESSTRDLYYYYYHYFYYYYLTTTTTT